MQRCGNCDRVIGRLEQPHVYQDEHIVCAQCIELLRRPSKKRKRTSTSRLDSQRKPRDEFGLGTIIRSKIAGVTYSNSDGSERQRIVRRYCRAGMPLVFRRDKLNPRDPNAIGIHIDVKILWFITQRLQLGHVRADLAERLAKFMDDGGAIQSEISEVTGGTKGDFYGVNIAIQITRPRTAAFHDLVVSKRQ